jgi:hypothetical protein
MSVNPVRQQSPLQDRNIINHPDIVHTLLDIMIEQKAYGTASRLRLLSRYHRDVIEGRVTSLKKRVVLVLDDYLCRDRRNDGSVE